MNNLPRISIVVPNLNSGHGLERAITSLLSQEYAYLQLIIADGGSTDASLGIIKQYREYLSTLISEPDEGQADALNKGFRHADG